MRDETVQETHHQEPRRVVVERVPVGQIQPGSIILPGIIHLGRAEVRSVIPTPGGVMFRGCSTDYPRVAFTYGPSMPVHIPYIPEVFMSCKVIPFRPPAPTDLDLLIRLEVIHGPHIGVEGWLLHGTMITPGLVWIQDDYGNEWEINAAMCRVVTSSKEE